VDRGAEGREQELARPALLGEFLRGDEAAAMRNLAAPDLPALRIAVAVEPVVIAFAAQFEAARPIAIETPFRSGGRLPASMASPDSSPTVSAYTDRRGSRSSAA
jgi:hypothetical protein